MEKCRLIFWTGTVLGIVVTSVDFWVGPIPYEIIIPIEVMSLVLIFTGLIMRKSKKMLENPDTLHKEET